ncbi:hypothetical protein [Tenacibaculum sp. 190524A02b]|uniref:Uncharacterized protein n=1 Tax=Tenacibaculum vairaonense TaxID=3137860 RepID=A0ABP1FJL5_9FLAO
MKEVHLPSKKNFIKYSFITLISLSVLTGCSDDESIVPPTQLEEISSDVGDNSANENVDHGESFTLETDTDFFINRDETINILVKGKYNEGTNPNIIIRGLVYAEGSTMPDPKKGHKTAFVSKDNKDVNAKVPSLPKGKVFTIRGYLVDNKGNYTFSNAITVSTNVDASTSRSLTFEFSSNKYFAINPTTFEPTSVIFSNVKFVEIIKEKPKYLGVEYSLKEDFSDAEILYISQNRTINNTGYALFIKGLQTDTKYYLRPIAKYADGTVVKGTVDIIETKK